MNMFICDEEKEQAYIAYIEKLKALNREHREGRQELILRDWNQQVRDKAFLSLLRNQLRQHQFGKSPIDRHSNSPVNRLKANYFSSERIAVYTCIFEGYDLLVNPVTKPNNIDYYVITDQPLSAQSLWILFDISHLANRLSHLSVVEQCRWYKMHPHLLFPDYNYSIYLDGNITPVSDLTEFIHYIGLHGIATHHHYMRDCVYEEAQTVIQREKDCPDRINLHLNFFREQGMPEGYGLADCSVIARKHHDPICISLMEQWWNEFLSYSRRDQLSFPYVLFKNGIKISDVTALGSNRMWNDALDIKHHEGCHV